MKLRAFSSFKVAEKSKKYGSKALSLPPTRNNSQETYGSNIQERKEI